GDIDRWRDRDLRGAVRSRRAHRRAVAAAACPPRRAARSVSDLAPSFVRIDEGLATLDTMLGADADLSAAARVDASVLAHSLESLLREAANDIQFGRDRDPDDATALDVRRRRLTALTTKLRSRIPGPVIGPTGAAPERPGSPSEPARTNG